MMNFSQQLESDYSKPTILSIVDHIDSDAGRFSVLMGIVLGEDAMLAQRAAWAVSHCLDVHPQLAGPHLDDMLALLDKNVHGALHRCVLRSLETIELPEAYHGHIIDVSFRILMDRKADIAHRVYAMTAIYRLSKLYPDIKPEFDLVLQEEMPNGSAGFRNRGKKMLTGRYQLRKPKVQ